MWTLEPDSLDSKPRSAPTLGRSLSSMGTRSAICGTGCHPSTRMRDLA